MSDVDRAIRLLRQWYPNAMAILEAEHAKTSQRHEIEIQVNGQLVRDVLVAMCCKEGVSIVSPFDPDKEAANYLLAQRLGIGSVFNLPDTEEEAK